MTSEGDHDPNTVQRIIDSVCTGTNELARGGQTVDNMAQLLAAIAAQVNQNILREQRERTQEADITQAHTQTDNSGEPISSDVEIDVPPATTALEECEGTGENFEINPQATDPADIAQFYTVAAAEDQAISRTVEVPTSDKPKPICVKFPVEIRKAIIDMRKEGMKSKEIAKELKVSVSGVQKVWQRFLATGMIHDRKPSTYAGRPRKYTYTQEPASPGFETQFLGNGSMEVLQSSSSQAEYADTPLPEEPTHAVVITTSSSDMFTEEPMDSPGATVEIVETPSAHTPTLSLKKKKGTPAYREQLLVRLIEDCPLAALREAAQTGATDTTNEHLQNIAVSVNKPLYMEYVLGHPFGKVPSPKPFDANSDEAQVILTDPTSPIGREVLAALGYSTKVYFNACCMPSPLFDPQKVISSLPISVGPGYLTESMRAVLQLLLDLCQDPVEALERIPCGPGPKLIARTLEGEVLSSHGFPPPAKLSTYWTELYEYSSLLECCGNFLSASAPSAPCLLCHPYESLVQKLEIKDLIEDDRSLTSSWSPVTLTAPATSSGHRNTPPVSYTAQMMETSIGPAGEVEVEVLQSGLVPEMRQTPLKRGRGRPRKSAGYGSRLQGKRRSGGGRGEVEEEEEQRVVSDGQFDMPIPEGNVSQVLNRESTAESEVPVVFTASPAIPVETIKVVEQTSALQIVQEPTSAFSGAQSIDHPVQPIATTALVTTLIPVSITPSQSTPAGMETDCVRQLQEGQTLGDSEGPLIVTGSEQQSIIERENEDLEPTSQQKGRGKLRKRTSPTKRVTVKSSPSNTAQPEGATNLTTQSSRTEVHARSSRKRTGNSGSGDTLMSSFSPGKRARQSTAAVGAQMGQEGESLSGGEGGLLNWGVEEVVEFIGSIPHCAYYTQVFREHEVDGECLLSLDPEMMVKLMGVKAGPALRIYKGVSFLRGQSTHN